MKPTEKPTTFVDSNLVGRRRRNASQEREMEKRKSRKREIEKS